MQKDNPAFSSQPMSAPPKAYRTRVLQLPRRARAPRQQVPGQRSSPATRYLLPLDALILLFIAFAMLLVVSLYLSHEHTFYVADAYFWPAKTFFLAQHYQELLAQPSLDAIASLVREVWSSTLDDYSHYYALPLAPFLALFGYSRHTYIACVALLYVLPLALSLGALSSRLIPAHGHLAFWSGVLITVLNPIIWVATLRGYPDAGAALLLSLAILSYVKSLEARTYRYLCLTGLLLSLAALFRRYFVYSVAAFFLALVFQFLLVNAPRLWRHSQSALQPLRSQGAQIGIVMATAALTLIILGGPFVYSLLTFDYATQFNEAERMSFVDTIGYYGTRYGWMAWAMAIAGFAAGILKGTVVLPGASIVALSGCLSVLLWAVHARAPVAAHGLIFVVFIIIGLVALLWTICLRLHGVVRVILVGAMGLYVVMNPMITVGVGDVSWISPLNGLLAAQYKPLVRDDYDEVARLVDYLRRVAGPDQRIYVAASSAALSFQTLRSAEETLYGRGQFLQLVSAESPLSNLLQADYVVVPTPVQFAGPEACGQAMRAAVGVFAEEGGIAADFRRLPALFVLGEGDGYPQGVRGDSGAQTVLGAGIRVEIYGRWRATSFETALTNVRRMSNTNSTCPNREPDWAILSPASSWVYIDRYNRYEFRTAEAHMDNPAAIFVDLPPIDGQSVVSGDLEYTGDTCTRPAVRLVRLTEGFTVVENSEKAIPDAGPFSISVPPGTADGEHIGLTIVSTDEGIPAVKYCGVRMEVGKPAESGSILSGLVNRVADQVRSRWRR